MPTTMNLTNNTTSALRLLFVPVGQSQSTVVETTNPTLNVSDDGALSVCLTPMSTMISCDNAPASIKVPFIDGGGNGDFDFNINGDDYQLGVDLVKLMSVTNADPGSPVQITPLSLWGEFLPFGTVRVPLDALSLCVLQLVATTRFGAGMRPATHTFYAKDVVLLPQTPMDTPQSLFLYVNNWLRDNQIPVELIITDTMVQVDAFWVSISARMDAYQLRDLRIRNIYSDCVNIDPGDLYLLNSGWDASYDMVTEVLDDGSVPGGQSVTVTSTSNPGNPTVPPTTTVSLTAYNHSNSSLIQETNNPLNDLSVQASMYSDSVTVRDMASNHSLAPTGGMLASIIQASFPSYTNGYLVVATDQSVALWHGPMLYTLAYNQQLTEPLNALSSEFTVAKNGYYAAAIKYTPQSGIVSNLSLWSTRAAVNIKPVTYYFRYIREELIEDWLSRSRTTPAFTLSTTQQYFEVGPNALFEVDIPTDAISLYVGYHTAPFVGMISIYRTIEELVTDVPNQRFNIVNGNQYIDVLGGGKAYIVLNTTRSLTDVYLRYNDN